MPEADGTLPLGKLSVVKAVLRGTIDAGAEAARQRFQLRVSASSFAERFSDLSAAQGVLDESGKGEYLRVNPPVGAVFVQASAYSPADSPAMHPLVGEHSGFAGSDDAAPPASPTQLAPEGGELNFNLVKVSSIVRGKLADRSGGQPCTLAISSQAGSLSAGLLRRYHDKGCAADSFAAYNLPLSPVFFTFWQDDDGDGVSNAGDHLGYFNADTTQSPPAPPSTGFTATDGREVTGIDIESFEVK